MEMPLHRPIPRRTFDITPASTDSSLPPSPAPEVTNPELLGSQKDMTPSRTRSILNLTSSTLFGIYSPVGTDSKEESSTPWGTGAQTPSHRRSIDDYIPSNSPLGWDQPTQITKPKVQRRGFHGYWLPLVVQTSLLFAFGVGYGSIVTHLHRTQRIKTIPLVDVERDSLYYQLSWGVFGILLGHALPAVDALWENSISPALSDEQVPSKPRSAKPKAANASGAESGSSFDSNTGPIWYSAVRSVGAFVGIAFAVRRLPWQSTLQVALTLALANPVLWYIIDRSLPGFAFSALVSIVGTVVLLLVDPNFVPLPAIHQSAASEQIGVYAWLASILFCTSICFGAIGRRLQL
ncbi:hypothetical protein B0A52_07993 [Exophiala mesophila]|uniref:INSIG domain protein n=1 Tax=Exophiala mesophila TaxID=212818 RepID=A0A438MZH5_EXOME|nr:hypothetical protein B0A52_07993 [Exophiala mesophila]